MAAHKAESCAPVPLCRELEPLAPCCRCQGSGGGGATRSTPGSRWGPDPAPRFAEPVSGCPAGSWALFPVQPHAVRLCPVLAGKYFNCLFVKSDLMMSRVRVTSPSPVWMLC